MSWVVLFLFSCLGWRERIGSGIMEFWDSRGGVVF